VLEVPYFVGYYGKDLRLLQSGKQPRGEEEITEGSKESDHPGGKEPPFKCPPKQDLTYRGVLPFEVAEDKTPKTAFRKR
jgi:hypothetical protein